MTYAITMVKCERDKRNEALEFLINLKTKENPFENGVSIDGCYISFGWPDYVLLLGGLNVELLKDAIMLIRNRALSANAGNLETSSIICTTVDEINDALEKIKKAGKEENGNLKPSLSPIR